MDKPAEKEIERQPNKIKGKCIAIQLKMKNFDNEMNDKYYLFDGLEETNTMKFTNNLYVTLSMMTYIY